MRTLTRKKQRELFLSKVTGLLLGLGAQQDEDGFTLQTRVGRLTLHPTANKGDGLGTVFTRFDDPQAARQLVDCNPFSGKWNFHYFNGWTLDTALEDFTRQIKRVMPGEMTLADHAEAWCREHGKAVPPRETAEWRKMYEAWAEWAFADLHSAEKRPPRKTSGRSC